MLRGNARLLRLSVLAFGLAATRPAHALQFENGEFKGSFDTSLSFGGLFRLGDPRPMYYGLANSFNQIRGEQASVNADDGNLNYGRGVVSELLKGSHELEVRYQGWGALVRGYWFTDRKTAETHRTKLDDRAKDRVVRGAEWLDLYARAQFNLGADLPLEVRVGRQVLSLGESTFIPNGINVVNPVDLSKLRVPGSELKEALLPVNMVKASLGVSPNLTLEPFWLLEFRRNELEPLGSYFSTNDFVTRGATRVFLGSGALSDSGPLGGVPRARDRVSSKLGEHGLALRLLAPALANTEFGVYYVRYNSRSPIASAVTASSAINPDLTDPLALAFAQGGLPAAQAAAQAGAIFSMIVKSQVAPLTLTPVELATLQSASVQAAIAGARRIALLQAAATSRYIVEYPENIALVGASFNAALGRSGMSLQGEVAYKRDVPLQVDDAELLYASLSALTNSPGAAFGSNNQIGNFLGQLGREIPGYRRHNVWTAQSTLTKLLGPTFGAQQMVLLGEVGGVWVNLPSQATLRYDGIGTFSGGDATANANTGNGSVPTTPAQAFPDRFSWGYQLAARLDYSNLFANVNVSPSLAFSHDVTGNTPLPLGNYLRGRKSVTLGAEFTYRNVWSLEMRYVNFFGADRYNLLGDRDYIATTVKYSF